MGKYTGQTWCNNCKQIVDTESENNVTFSCVLCGKVFNKEGKAPITTKDVWKVKSTPENLERVFWAIWEHMPDNHGQGDLDEETGIMRCVEWCIEHLLELNELK